MHWMKATGLFTLRSSEHCVDIEHTPDRLRDKEDTTGLARWNRSSHTLVLMHIDIEHALKRMHILILNIGLIDWATAGFVGSNIRCHTLVTMVTLKNRLLVLGGVYLQPTGSPTLRCWCTLTLDLRE